MVGEGQAPLGQYFLASTKADESIAARKGADPGPRNLLSCKRAVSRGPLEGIRIASLDPDAPTLSQWRGHPPLWQYFSRQQED
jgi:hypothetical protein